MRRRGSLLLLLAAALVPGCAGPSVNEVSQTPQSAHEPSLATFSDGFVVSWYDTRDGHGEIYARSLTADGIPDGPEWRLTTAGHDSFEPDVHALGEQDFVIGWYEKTAPAAMVPRLGRWSRGGRQMWIATLAPSGRNTVVRADKDRIFAAWLQDEDAERASVWAGWWRATGEVAVPARRVADASRTTWNLNAAVAPGSTATAPRAWIVFDAKAGTQSDELFAVDVDVSTAVVARLSADDGISSKYPDASLSGDRVAITWFDTVGKNEDVYLAVGPAFRMLQPQSLATPATVRLTATAGHSIGAYLAWNGSRLGVAWCDDTWGQHEIYLQTFDATGRPERQPDRITDTPAASLIPAIEPWRTGFAMAWSEYVAAEAESHGDGRGQIAMKVVP